MCRLLSVCGSLSLILVFSFSFAPVATATDKDQRQTMIDQAKAAVKEELRDPEAARFLSARFATPNNDRGEPLEVVCGEVSATNGFGGRNRIDFVYIVKVGQLWTVDRSTHTMQPVADELYSRFCRHPIP